MCNSIHQLAGHFATQLNELPDDVRDFVGDKYPFGDWDSLSPTQRIHLAWQNDTPHTAVQRLERVHSLQSCIKTAQRANPAGQIELQNLRNRIKTTLRHQLTDQLNRATQIPTPTDVERLFKHKLIQEFTTSLEALDINEFDPEAELPPITQPLAVAEVDRCLLATHQQLIDAFGSFTGMDNSWFSNLKDTPALLAARKVKGQGGRGHIVEPLFCPFHVLQWLIDPKRRKGRKLGKEKGWQLFERYFPRAHTVFETFDPRSD